MNSSDFKLGDPVINSAGVKGKVISVNPKSDYSHTIKWEDGRIEQYADKPFRHGEIRHYIEEPEATTLGERVGGLKLIQSGHDADHYQVSLPTGEHIMLRKSDIIWMYEQISETLTRHRLTSGLVSILVNMAKTVHAKDRNDIHIYTEIGEVCGPQAYSGMSNISKLRFHGLAFKIRGEDGKQIKGRWGITRRGGQFLRGEIEIPEFVLTKANHVEGHEGKMMRIHALRPEGPVEFEQRESITYTSKAEDRSNQPNRQPEAVTLFSMPHHEEES